MRWKFLVLLLAVSMLGCRGTTTQAVDPWIGKPFPGFALPSANGGDSLRSGQLRGKVTLVTFWATWCPSCLQEIPLLKGIHKAYGPKGLEIQALSVDEQPELVLPLMQKLGLEYPVATGAQNLHVRMGLAFIPHTFLVDTAGTIRASFTGGVEKETLEQAMQESGLP